MKKFVRFILVFIAISSVCNFRTCYADGSKHHVRIRLAMFLGCDFYEHDYYITYDGITQRVRQDLTFSAFFDSKPSANFVSFTFVNGARCDGLPYPMGEDYTYNIGYPSNISSPQGNCYINSIPVKTSGASFDILFEYSAPALGDLILSKCLTQDPRPSPVLLNESDCTWNGGDVCVGETIYINTRQGESQYNWFYRYSPVEPWVSYKSTTSPTLAVDGSDFDMDKPVYFQARPSNCNFNRNRNSNESNSITFKTPAPDNITLAVSPASCEGNSPDGKINVVPYFKGKANDGGLNLGYFLFDEYNNLVKNLNSNERSVTIENIESGGYSLRIGGEVHGDGFPACYNYFDVVVGHGPVLSDLVTNLSHPMCHGGNGSIGVTVQNGPPPFTFRIKGTAHTSTKNSRNHTFGNLSAGPYNVEVEDACGNKLSANVALTQPTAIIFTSTPSSPTCPGGDNGSINVLPSGGIPGGYDFYIDDIKKNTVKVPEYSFTGLSAGTYTVKAQDSNGCEKTAIITIPDPPQLSIGVNKENVECKNEPDGAGTGSIEINYTGNQGEITKAFLNGTEVGFEVSNNSLRITGLDKGTYNVKLRDEHCESEVVSVTISEPTAQFNADFTHTDLTCFEANDGIITVNATGGWGDYLYQIDNNGWQPSGNFTGLGKGVYNVKAIDRSGTGCEITTTVEITEPAPLEVEVIGEYDVDPVCNRGAAVVTTRNGRLAGSSTPYSYILNNSNLPSCVTAGDLPCYVVQSAGALYETIIIRNISSGTYNFTASIGANCSLEESIQIGTKTNALAINKITVVSMDDCTVPSGSLLIELANADPGTIYNYANIESSYNHSETVPFSGQDLAIVIRDSIRGCPLSQQIKILPGAPSVNIGQHVTCHEGSDGKISFQISEGLSGIRSIGLTSPGFVKTLDKDDISSDGQYITYKGDNIIEVEGLPAGTYQIEIITETYQSCTILSNSFTISQPPLVERTGGQELNTGCFGQDDGFVRFNVAGGNGGFRAVLEERLSEGQWEVRDARTAVHNAVTGQEEIIFSGLKNTVGTTGYRYRIYDAQDCESQYHNFSVQGIERGLSVSISPQRPTCPDRPDGSLTANASGGQEGQAYIYEWYRTIDGNETALTETSGQLSDIEEGTYKVIVTDANGCQTEGVHTLISRRIHATHAHTSDFNGFNVSCHAGENGSLGFEVYGNSPVAGAYPFNFLVERDGKGILQVEDNEINRPDPSENITVNIGERGGESGEGSHAIYYHFLNLKAGNYIFTFGDKHSCDTTIQVVLNEPAPLTWETSFEDPVCFDGQGTISATVSGGAPTSEGLYTYTLEKLQNADGSVFNPIEQGFEYDGPAITGNGANALTYTFDLPAGKYRLTISDKNYDGSETGLNHENCILITDLALTDPPALKVVFNTGQEEGDVCKDPTCFEGNDGTIAAYVVKESQYPEEGAENISVIDRDSPYMWTIYKVNDPAYRATYETNFLKIDTLLEGTYDLSVRSLQDCESINMARFELKGPERIEIRQDDIVLAPASCSYALDGSIGVRASGGRPFTEGHGYTYSLDKINYVAPELVSSSESEDIYSFFIRNIPGLTDLDTVVYIRDGAGCADSTIVRWYKTERLNYDNLRVDNIRCHGEENGRIEVDITGGNGGYGYIWEHNGEVLEGANGNVITNLQAGNYTLTVLDEKGCEHRFDHIARISGPGLFEVINYTVHDALPDRPDGSVSISVNPQDGNIGYVLYNQENETFREGTVSSGNFMIGSLPEGNYVLKIYNPNGCEASIEIPIGRRDMEFNFIAQNISCTDNNDGQIEVKINGGDQYLEYYEYAVNDGTFTASNIFTGLAEGTYTIYVRERLTEENPYPKEVATAGAIIENPSPLSVDLTKLSGYSCSTGPGQVEVSIMGGTPPYTMELSSEGTVSWSRTNIEREHALQLYAGSHDLVVRDSRGCEAWSQVDIEEEDGGMVPVEGQPFLVLGQIKHTGTCGPTGTVALSLENGGDGPTFFLTDREGGTAHTAGPWFSGLDEGWYKVYALSGAGDQSNEVCFFIDKKQELSAAVVYESIESASCPESADGQVKIRISGGTGPFEVLGVESGPVHFDLDEVFISGLTAGNYTITVQDNDGCAIAVNVEIPVLEALALQTSYLNPTCRDAADGKVEFEIAGGRAPYQYELLDVANNVPVSEGTGRLGAITEIPDGEYILRIKDRAACALEKEVTLTAPARISASLHQDNTKAPTCYHSDDGILSISVSGGTLNYSEDYKINWIGHGVTGRTLPGIPGGIYSVEISDSHHCRETFVFELPAPDTVIVNVIRKVNPSCTGGATGLIEIGIQNARTPHITWTDGAGTVLSPSNTTTLRNLKAGTYIANVRDGNGCTFSQQIVLEDNPPLEIISESLFHPDCFGGTSGSIVIETGGGQPLDTGGYTITWSNGQTGPNISGLMANTYTVAITDKNGCTVTKSYNLPNPPQLEIYNVERKGLRCHGAGDGEIKIDVKGGRPPYEITWSNGVSGNITTGLTAGTYDVSVTDSKGCALSGSYVVSQPANLAVAPTISNTGCHGSCDGVISLRATGGRAPYLIEWSTGAISDRLTGLCPGRYTYTLTDANNCTLTGEVALSGPPVLRAKLELNNGPSCAGGNNGMLRAIGEGGTPPYSYSWSSGSISATNNGLAAGGHGLTITDANGCTVNETYQVLDPPVFEVAEVLVGNVGCNGGNDGEVELIIVSEGPGLDISWSNGASTRQISGLRAGTYHYTVRNSGNCQVEGSVTINQPSPISVQEVGIVMPVCSSSCDGAIEVGANGGAGDHSYSWSNGMEGKRIENLCSGSYTVTVSDKNNCTVQRTITLQEPSPLRVLNTNVMQPTCTGLCNGSANLQVLGGEAPYHVTWNDGETGHQREGLCEGTYMATITDNRNCAVTQEIQILYPVPAEVTGVPDFFELCLGGRRVLDAGTGWQSYEWSSPNGFEASTRRAEINREGEYALKTISYDGCEAVHHFTVEIRETALIGDFVVTTTAIARDTVVLVDVSWPVPERVEWTVPDGVAEHSENGHEVRLVFRDAGTYPVSMRAFLDGCEAYIEKEIEVLPMGSDKGPWEGGRLGHKENKLEASAYPNPSQGRFTVKVEMELAEEVTVSVMDIYRGRKLKEYSLGVHREHEVEVEVGGFIEGVYLVRIETPTTNKVIKVNLQK